MIPPPGVIFGESLAGGTGGVEEVLAGATAVPLKKFGLGGVGMVSKS